MAKPLTYPSLKCVLEYMEANTRIHICTRNPALRKIERKIPLHLEYITFSYSSITLNEITFQLYSRINGINGYHRILPYPLNQFGTRDESTDYILLPGDISLRSGNSYRQAESESDNHRLAHPIHLYFKNSDGPYSYNRVPEHLKFHVALKLLTSVLLGNRTEIFVKRFEIDVLNDLRLSILRLPPDLKLNIQKLEVYSSHIENLIPLINIKRLKTLKINWCDWDDSCFKLPIVQSVQKLYINGFSGRHKLWINTLLKLPNRDITFYCYSSIAFGDFIQGLLDEGKDIGTCYTIEDTISFSCGFKDIGERFGVEVVQEFHSNGNYTSYSLSIPMSATTKLSICGTNEQASGCTKIKVVPISPQDCTHLTPSHHKTIDGCWMTVYLIFFFLITLILSIMFFDV